MDSRHTGERASLRLGRHGLEIIVRGREYIPRLRMNIESNWPDRHRLPTHLRALLASVAPSLFQRL